MILTDGLASDGKDACTRARQLRNISSHGIDFDVRTFGIAFGRFADDFVEEEQVTGRQNMLECIAADGGTDVDDDLNGDGVADGPGVLYPQNKQELVDRLLENIQLLRPQPRTLTGVAVPSVQADAADKVYLTDFTPLSSRPVWPGHVHAFVKPLPLDEVRQAALRGLRRPAGRRGPKTSCYLYDVGEQPHRADRRAHADDIVGGARRNGASTTRCSPTPAAAAASRCPRERRTWRPSTTPAALRIRVRPAGGLRSRRR